MFDINILQQHKRIVDATLWADETMSMIGWKI